MGVVQTVFLVNGVKDVANVSITTRPSNDSQVLFTDTPTQSFTVSNHSIIQSCFILQGKEKIEETTRQGKCNI
jgi:hypothetical protein